VLESAEENKLNNVSAPTVCAGIACYNRERLYYHTLESYRDSKIETEVLIFDDASSTIDHNKTLELVPSARVFVNSFNSGRADFAMRLLMTLYLQESEADYFLFLDSDLQLSESLKLFLPLLLRNKDHDGVFSLFNTPAHPGEPLNETWLIKKTIGAAGAVLSRSWVNKILEHVPPSTRYDWDWSNFVWQNNKRILCTKYSYVQHLGFAVGQNSTNLLGDYGIDFQGATLKQLTLILEEMHAALRGQMERQLHIKNALAAYQEISKISP
jgi:glycosyltransferase involved in cell wall biosynthesis